MPSYRPYDSRQIANFFIQVAHADGEKISIMKMLKLVYIAHGWNLAIFDRPLINDQVEAWKFGPVVPSLYYIYRRKGVYDIDIIEIYDDGFDDDTFSIIGAVQEQYKGFSATQLSMMTHVPGGPWAKTYEKGEFTVIPEQLIAAHYKEKLEGMLGDH